MFLLALAENEDDTVTRLVYADWLEDHDEYEEADRQRKWPEAKRWLENICKEHNAGCREDQKLSYDQLLDFGRKVAALTNVNIEVETDIPDSYGIVTEIRDKIPEFWKAWSIVTGLSLPPSIEQKYYYLSGYCCQNEIYADTHVAGPIPEEVIRAEEERVRLRKEEEDEWARLREEEEEQARLRQLEEAEERRQRGFDVIQDELEKDRP
jgi:uncharacterized protein (TIGR02996 family)